LITLNAAKNEEDTALIQVSQTISSIVAEQVLNGTIERDYGQNNHYPNLFLQISIALLSIKVNGLGASYRSLGMNEQMDVIDLVYEKAGIERWEPSMR
jgi:hypothetical protein